MVTKDTKTCAEFLNNAEYREPVERLVCRSGVRPDMSGYPLLVDAIMLYGTGELKNFGSIFAAIGAVRSKTFALQSAPSIMRSPTRRSPSSSQNASAFRSVPTPWRRAAR